MEKKFYNFKTSYGSIEKIWLQATTYRIDGTLAVQAFCEDNVPYTIVTVNLSESGAKPLNKNRAFVKDYSENKGIGKFLEENGIAKPTGIVVSSGYVDIREYEFDLTKIN